MEPVDTPRIFSGRYELTHLIARGGMAQVYRAHDRLLDRPVALKVLFPELSIDRAFVERFRREAQAAANLSHPNIVQVFDWGEDGGTYFIVMELVDGNPLSALLRASGTLPAHRAADIGAHVAAALSYAHRHGVVHRDVKPGNVLITDDGQVKVTDFGIARAVNTEESLTQTGAVMGTAAYFSPEQAEGIGVDGRSDIYSLGVVLFEMVTGRAPFLGDSPVAVASKHVRDQPPLPRDLNPLVPAALESVIMKAMSKSPDQRYQTADDLRADLLRFADGRPVIAGDPVATSMMAAAGVTQAVNIPNPTAAVPAVPGGGGPPAHRAAGGDDEGNRNKRLLITLGVLVLVLLIVAFFLLRSLGYLGGSSGLTVPNLVGKTAAQATATLQSEGLSVGSTSTRTSSEAANTVLATDPTSGTSIKKGEAVKLVLSAGPTVAAVPMVVGQNLNDALTLLQSAGFNNYTRVLQNSDKPGGTVLSVNPAPGTKVSTSVTIRLTVSNQNAVQVPSVAGLTQTAAGAALSKANLTVGTTSSQCSNNQATGLVISSSPAAGATEPPNTTVNLVVSTGSCSVVLQDTTGQSQAQATSTLQGQSPQITVTSTTTSNCQASSNGNVINQSPSGGTQVNVPVTVTLTVCSNTTTTTSAPTTTTTAPATTTTTSVTTTQP